MQSETLLTGRIFDDRGNRMSPTHARKGSVKYRYYLSSALLQGAAERAGSVRRVPAAQIDALVVRSVRDRLALSEPMDERAIVERHVARVEVHRERLVVDLAERCVHRECAVQIPWQKPIQEDVVKFLCRMEYRRNTRVRSARKRASGWSRQLGGGAVGSRNLLGCGTDN